MICTFFGHRDYCRLDTTVLKEVIEELISKGVDIFYVGNQGYFDGMVLNILTNLHKKHRHILYSVVTMDYRHIICLSPTKRTVLLALQTVTSSPTYHLAFCQLFF